MMKEMWIYIADRQDNYFERFLKLPDLRYEVETVGETSNPYIVLSGPRVPQNIGNLEGVVAASNLATRIGGLLNAATHVLFGNSDLRLPKQYFFQFLVDDTGVKHFPGLYASSVERSTMIAFLGDGSAEREMFSGWLSMSFGDKAVEDALWWFSREPDWFSLWKVYEAVYEDLGGYAQLDATGWWTKAQHESFRASSNDPRISGDAARHQRSRGHVVGTPVNLDEGAELIRSLLRSWLESKRTALP